MSKERQQNNEMDSDDVADQTGNISLAIDSEELDSVTLSERMRMIEDEECQPLDNEQQLIDNISWDNSSDDDSELSMERHDTFDKKYSTLGDSPYLRQGTDVPNQNVKRNMEKLVGLQNKTMLPPGLAYQGKKQKSAFDVNSYDREMQELNEFYGF